MGYYECDLRTGDFVISQEMERIFACTSNPPKSNSDLQRFVHAEDREMYSQRQQNARAAGGACEIVYRITTPNDGIRYIQDHSEWKTAQDGSVETMHGTIVNITDRKAREQEIHDARERLARFIDAATDTYALFDEQQSLIEIDNKSAQQLGYESREAVLGRQLTHLFPFVREHCWPDAHLEVIRNARSFEFETRYFNLLGSNSPPLAT